MTLLTTVQQVCPFIGVDVPDSIFSGLTSDRTKQELLELANEMARRIASDTRDWTRLKFAMTFTGNGTSGSFDLPTDYLRIPVSSNMWRSTSTQTPMRFIPDTDEWSRRRLAGEYDSRGEWTIFQGKMHIAPVMDGSVPAWVNNFHYSIGVLVHDPVDWSLWTSKVDHTSSGGTFASDRAANPTYWVSVPHTTATIIYISKNCIRLATPPNSFNDRFIADGDSFLLDERLLKLGMIWQWKAQKGSPYAEDMGTYGDALTMAMGFDQPSPIIVGRMPLSANARVVAPSYTIIVPATP